mmetsp:Transcript_36315/g.104533  ORF Transcript_36315/g.104533 Transcript_36315/m.104533 type:complete len:1088 (-) Transcript_36315:48-3311(-)
MGSLSEADAMAPGCLGGGSRGRSRTARCGTSTSRAGAVKQRLRLVPKGCLSILALCSLAPTLLAMPSVRAGADLEEGLAGYRAAGQGSEVWPLARRLQSSNSVQAAEDVAPTLDEVDSVFFSRPPYSVQEQSMTVFYTFAGMYVICALTVVVGFNLDAAERRKRLARAIVPQEYVTHKMLCCKVTLPLENVPCEITEQYYMDQRLMTLRNDNEMAYRKQPIGLRGYLSENARNFFDILLREHTILSFLLKNIPTFTRVKRAALIVLQLHVIMIVGSLVLNAQVHNTPRAKYVLVGCGGQSSEECFATVPHAILAAVVACPVFRFAIYRQMRLMCFASQSHPSTSQFPLGMRKFASLAPKSLAESLLCMRNEYERHKLRVAQQRTFAHRLVHALWQSTHSSIKDLRFYSPVTSWCIALAMFAFVACSGAYVLSYTVYLNGSVVYHWLVWLVVMFSFWTFLLEPLFIFWTQVMWSSLVATVAQKWGYGSHSLAATTAKYTEVMHEVDDAIVTGLQKVASVRIQRWWVDMRDQLRQATCQNSDALSMQKARRKRALKKNFLKEKKWCLQVEVIDCSGLPQELELGDPFVRLSCDTGNDIVNDTRAVENAGTSAVFNETFFVDIKESGAMNVQVWSRSATAREEFIAGGAFDFEELRAKEERDDRPEGHVVRVRFTSTSASAPVASKVSVNGHVNLRVTFLDPLKDQCGLPGQENWMLPKHRMQISLSRMSSAIKLGHLLGGNRTPRSNYETSAPGEAADEARPASAAGVRTSLAQGARQEEEEVGVEQADAQQPNAQQPDAAQHPDAALEPNAQQPEVGAQVAEQPLQAGAQSGTHGPLEYIADKSRLENTDTAGLPFHTAKDLDKLVEPESIVHWGSKIKGVDEGDGWLRVEQEASEDLFLPMMLREKPVLLRTPAVAPQDPSRGPSPAPGQGPKRPGPGKGRGKGKPLKVESLLNPVEDGSLPGAVGGRPPRPPGMGPSVGAGARLNAEPSLSGSRRPSNGSAVGAADMVSQTFGPPVLLPGSRAMTPGSQMGGAGPRAPSIASSVPSMQSVPASRLGESSMHNPMGFVPENPDEMDMIDAENGDSAP